MTFTPTKKAQFIKVLGQTGNVARTARACRVSRWGAYVAKRKDPEFASAWDDAIEQYADYLEAECDRRAIDGVDEPIYYQGQICGYKRNYSDTLLIFRLKALRPEKYRERTQKEVAGNVNLFPDKTTGELIAIAKGSLAIEAVHQ